MMTRGEQRELSIPNLSHFSVGNKHILQYHYNAQNKQFLLKAKSLGFSDIIFWNKLGKKSIYKIYVLSKADQLELLRLTETLEHMGLKTRPEGALIIVQGSIEKKADFLLLQKLEKDFSKLLFLKVEISPDLQKEIMADIYPLFLKEGIYDISCYTELLKIICAYSQPEGQKSAGEERLLKTIEQKYQVSFLPSSSPYLSKNFKAKLKILQVERSDGKEFSFGLSQIQTTWGELFTQGIKSLIQKNEMAFQESKITVSTLAEPEIIMRLNAPSFIQVGAEIPYTASTANTIQTQWKFAGLELKLNLKAWGDKFSLEYSSELTRPSDMNQVSGNKESSSVMLELNQPIEIFQIGIKTLGKKENALPWIHRFPLMGELFKSHAQAGSHKKIIAILLLESYE
ncbi:MAG: pilus assembly protein N-terminal domain-containing protein [Bacteriovoracaceae bacterium]|nr:pilus assembly protein N-terminal domain-containing protein [Bacteriovoracaceae bacterium]